MNIIITVTRNLNQTWKMAEFKSLYAAQGLIQDFWLGGDNNMLESHMCIKHVIVLAILHILIGIGLTNKLQNRHIELQLAG